MVERILQVLEYSTLSPAQFAEHIGINRSAMTHFKSGRNKPSLEVVIKILQMFPAINPDWLLMGKGEMLQRAQNPSLDSHLSSVASGEVAVAEAGVQGGSLGMNLAASLSGGNGKYPVRMTIYYSDSTFDTFRIDKEHF
jgi:DNA-binding XRE family transcriptional regulator